MGYGVYENRGRWAGYGVPAYCEHPDCDAEIDRGMSYACGGEPFSEVGCDRYFCGKHLHPAGWDENNGEWCEHEFDDPKCECEFHHYCERCISNQVEFPRKPEHPHWVYHLLHDESWAEWRKNNPEQVKYLQTLPAEPSEHVNYG